MRQRKDYNLALVGKEVGNIDLQFEMGLKTGFYGLPTGFQMGYRIKSDAEINSPTSRGGKINIEFVQGGRWNVYF